MRTDRAERGNDFRSLVEQAAEQIVEFPDFVAAVEFAASFVVFDEEAVYTVADRQRVLAQRCRRPEQAGPGKRCRDCRKPT